MTNPAAAKQVPSPGDPRHDAGGGGDAVAAGALRAARRRHHAHAQPQIPVHSLLLR